MSKHTPGPWHWVNSVTDEPYDFDAQWDGHGYPSLRTVKEYGENKTEVRDGGTYTSYALPKWILDAEPMENGNDVANARLIAAAPELLNALISGAQLNMPDFLEWISARLVNVHGEDPNVDYVQTLRHRAKLCREAIAKATGTGA